MRTIISALAILFIPLISLSQNGFPVNGVADEFNSIRAFTNCTLIKDPSTKMTNAVILVQKGKIIGAGQGLKIPDGAIITDLKGDWVYPGFIDIWSEIGLPPTETKRNERGPQFLSSKSGAWYWNEAIHPEIEANAIYTGNTHQENAKTMRSMGFGAVVSHQPNGISRGTGMLVHIGEESGHSSILQPVVGQYFSFDKGNSTQDYPSSQMGSIALLRQFFYDARWYKSGKAEEKNLSLEAYNLHSNQPHFFEVEDAQEVLRADKLGDEFALPFIIKGRGDEYTYAERIKQSGVSLVLPLEFPEPFDMEDPLEARLVGFSELKHWEMAPFNPCILHKQGIEFCFTLNGMKKKEQFLSNLRYAVQNGLPEEVALRALTTVPAKMIRCETMLGSIEIGKVANFVICDGNIFKEGTVILQNYISGKAYTLLDKQAIDYSGKYNIEWPDTSSVLTISGKPWSPKAELKPKGRGELKSSVKNGFLHLTFTGKSGISMQLSGYKEGNDLYFYTTDSMGGRNVIAKYIGVANPPAEDSVKTNPPVVIPGFQMPWQYQVAQPSTFVIKNATLWTNEKEGKRLNTDILVKNGKITSIGTIKVEPGATVIDGTGKHVTPGIIDEHSHIALSKGVNEGTQSITSEVRIEDVVNAEDVNIYRQLAGGVTTSHLLHGSANAIGGQTALIKLKYGESAPGLLFPTDHRFIKFALGENVKQSNWGDRQTVRYPQTRMGVEQVFLDGFTRAKKYGELKKIPGNRTDLELEALLEILNSQRFITCHSYVQSEINMLMHVADKFGFKVNTFTHILEGYKVADKMQKHGAAGSTFADWWAYKFEVVEAIPYNASIMNKAGVLTGINSDDAEMGRRLNQEAAKTMKYGGVSDTAALKMVTLNPAKMLHIDAKVGSLAPGKDADIVLWDGDPLSLYSKAVTTWIDGKIYFDRALDVKQRAWIAKERKRLTDAMIFAKKNGSQTRKPESKKQPEYHCEDEE